MANIDEFTVSAIEVDEEERLSRSRILKTKTDYDVLGKQIAAHKANARAAAGAKGEAGKGAVSEALEGLLAMEKQQRLQEDVQGTIMCCEAVLEVCFEGGHWAHLNEHLTLLAKRRAQLKQVIQGFVSKAMGYLEQAPDKETKVTLIKTLLAITEGKIFVELERARLTRKLAAIKEGEGNIAEAAEVMQELAVETFGAMARREKVAFILEQVRLCLDKGDYIRAQIMSRKVSAKAFVEAKNQTDLSGTAVQDVDEGIPEMADLKEQYYRLLIRYHSHFNSYLEIARSYRAIFDTPRVQENGDLWKPILKKICWYIVLAPKHSKEGEASQSDQFTLLQTTFKEKKLEELAAYKELLQIFINKEVIRWNLVQSWYKDEIKNETEAFGGEAGPQRMKDLQDRVTEHNIISISKFYTRITTKRLAQLIDGSHEEAEQQLSDMVVSKAVQAKIDRPAGIIYFKPKQGSQDVLNTWSGSISKLLDLVERSCQQIQKEAMQFKVPIGTQ